MFKKYTTMSIFTLTHKFTATARNKRGFSLVETLVAIAILTVVLSTTLSLARQGLSTAFFAKEQMVGFYLAVEGMEFVRHKRATNVINGLDWLDGFGTGGSACFDLALGCSVDIHTKVVSNCPAGCLPLQYNSVTNEYGYANGGTDTNYVRTITLSETIPDQEALVTVTVSIQVGSFVARDVVLEERILNWAAGF